MELMLSNVFFFPFFECHHVLGDWGKKQAMYDPYSFWQGYWNPSGLWNCLPLHPPFFSLWAWNDEIVMLQFSSWLSAVANCQQVFNGLQPRVWVCEREMHYWQSPCKARQSGWKRGLWFCQRSTTVSCFQVNSLMPLLNGTRPTTRRESVMWVCRIGIQKSFARLLSTDLGSASACSVQAGFII